MSAGQSMMKGKTTHTAAEACLIEVVYYYDVLGRRHDGKRPAREANGAIT